MRVLILGLLVAMLGPFSYASTLVIEVSKKEIKTLSFQNIKDMPSTKISTHLPWFKGEAEFTGVGLSYLLTNQFGEIPESTSFRALNDYSVDINKADIEKYQPILAYLKDGNTMTVREKGPYWVVFSLKDNPSIDNSEYHSKMIWQLEKISN
jgi:hypothetical protein